MPQPPAPVIPTTPTPPEVDAARGLLSAITARARDPFERIAAASALGALCDVVPPYPPLPDAETALDGQALLDEATSALIEAIRASTDADERGRALFALEELHPLPLLGDPAGTAPETAADRR